MTGPTWKRGAKMDLSYLWLEGGGVDSVMLVLNSSITVTEHDADLLHEKPCGHSQVWTCV